MTTYNTIGVIGAGAWGTALANAAARAGRQVRLWGRNAATLADMAAKRRSVRLGGIALHERVIPTTDLNDAAQADALIFATPTQTLRSVAASLNDLAAAGIPIVIAAKGIERATGLFVADILKETLLKAIPAVLSGPSFASDVVAGRPTAVTLACADADLGERLALSLASPAFRIYHTTDIRGVEIGGAAKNVLAIAAGIAAGKELGESAVAALIARGFAELCRFGEAYGARSETLGGLSGLGDLILTGTSSQSRNRRLGEALGRGSAIEQAIQAVGLAEGVWTAEILVQMAEKRGVVMPIASVVAEVVSGKTTAEGAIDSLLSRPQRAEI